MGRYPSLARKPLFALATLLAVLAAASGGRAAGPVAAAAKPAAAMAAPTAAPTAAPGDTGGNTTTPPGGDTSGSGGSLLQDETSLLSDPIPDLTSGIPMSNVPPITGSVAGLETSIVGLLGRVQASSLSPAARGTVTDALQTLIGGLGPTLDLQDRVDGLRGQENALLQARLDGQAAIDKIDAQIQVSLDRLRVDVESTVNANVTASVGSISVTVTGGADLIQAQLGAKVNRLLVNVVTDIDVLHIATLHATANVDTARLNVNLFAQVKRLRLDLGLLLRALKVTVRADVAAALTAEASLTASLAAEVDGLKADLAANIDTKVGGLDTLLTSLIRTLNGELGATARTLQGLQAQVR